MGIVYPDSGSSEFVYDALGRRLKTIERDSEGAVIEETHYVYDGLDLIAELDGNNALVASYTFGPGIDDPVNMNYDGEDYFFLKNHLGSIMEITDIYQNTVKTYDYDSFGSILDEDGSLAHNAFTYTSREYHPRSGLYYYRARWYDPEIGRFISRDPIGFLGGMNLYAYAGNNSMNWIDPFGLRSLTRGEIGILTPIYGQSIDYSRVDIREGGLLTFFGYGVTVGNVIRFPSSGYSDDFSKCKEDDIAWLVHEMAHVWQNQNLPEYSWGAALREHFRYRNPYFYINNSYKQLTDYRYEQQAQMVEDHYLHPENFLINNPIDKSIDRYSPPLLSR